MISNRNIINLILELKKKVLQPYHCLIDSLFLIERFYNVKKTKKTKKSMVFLIKKTKKTVKKTDQPWYILLTRISNVTFNP